LGQKNLNPVVRSPKMSLKIYHYLGPNNGDKNDVTNVSNGFSIYIYIHMSQAISHIQNLLFLTYIDKEIFSKARMTKR
jgi:hypothetical protein